MSVRMEQSMANLRDALAAVLPEAVEFPRGTLVTVLDARMTRDELHAAVRLSVLPASQEGAVLQTLIDGKGEIDYLLSKKVRLRRIPKFVWQFDDTEAIAADIDATLNQLKASGEL